MERVLNWYRLPLLLLGLAWWGEIEAQTIESIGDANATASDGFTSIFAVVELMDGRVLMTDIREGVIAVVDLDEGSVKRLGRKGEGPLEYQSTSSILRDAGGGYRVSDLSQQRFVLVSAEGEITGTRRFVRPSFSSLSPPRGGEAGGWTYVTRRQVSDRGLSRATQVYRWYPDTGQADSVGVMMAYAPGQEGVGLIPMALGDAWSTSPDGSLARIVAEDYHVEWSGGPGGEAIGPTIAFRRVRVNGVERDRWIEEIYSRPSGGSVVTLSAGGGASSGLSAPAQRYKRAVDNSRFPDFVPPFRWGYTPSAPWGHIWIRLDVQSDEMRTVFDVIDRGGQLVRRVSIEGRASIVGFGPHSIYISRKDEVDLEWLMRFDRMPSGADGGG